MEQPRDVAQALRVTALPPRPRCQEAQRFLSI